MEAEALKVAVEIATHEIGLRMSGKITETEQQWFRSDFPSGKFEANAQQPGAMIVSLGGPMM